MKPILTPEESAELDRQSRDRGVTVELLMENAGRAVARAAVAIAGGAYGRRAVVVCGKGNNGGDGLVAARHLRRWGMGATVVLLPSPESLREPASTMLRRFEEIDARVRGGDALARELGRADVVVDAVFGTGFRGRPEDVPARAIGAINDAARPVVAVDIPSGVNGDTGAVTGTAVAATTTVTFGAPKPGLLFYPGAGHAGVIQVADIGFPSELVRSDFRMVEQDDVAALWHHRDPAGHKRSSGVVLVIAGSRRMTGAVRLVAESAYRAGAGLVTVAVPEGILRVAQRLITEATFLPLPETDGGAVASAALDTVTEQLDGFDALAIGPGLSTDEETSSFVRSLMSSTSVPTVADADALNAFAGRATDIAEHRSDLVLTPHDGEFVRLAGGTIRELHEDRLGRLRKLAGETRAAVLLKGHPALVASPTGEVRLNPTGGPALSTAGTGDVLTGATAALLARGSNAFDAATAAAFVHGLAGDLAALSLGEGTTALDVLARLPEAVRLVQERA
jgi:ADP-dependent NAD(P)H-hydrate dehydratase / NAD(P)H-hydrate epimerase